MEIANEGWTMEDRIWAVFSSLIVHLPSFIGYPLFPPPPNPNPHPYT